MSRLLCVLLVCGCGSGRETSKSAAPVQVVVAPEVAAATPPSAATVPAATSGDAKSERAHGLAYRLASSAAKPVEIPSIGQLIVADQTGVTLDLEDGTRLTAAPHARLCALAFAPSLMLVSGQAHVTRLPDALRAGSVAARIATLTGALETTPGTEATLRVETQLKRERAPGKRRNTGEGQLELRTQLQLERGGTTWLSLATDERDPLRETQLLAGAAPLKPITGLHWLAAGAAFDASFARLAWLKEPTSEQADGALEAALSEQQALRERGHELLASVSPHHAALAKLARDGSAQANAKPEAASTREYQRALVEHAQRSHAHAAQLLLAAERSLLHALLACADDASGSCAAVQAWSERFSARCASLL
jgi:hypothetical protein